MGAVCTAALRKEEVEELLGLELGLGLGLGLGSQGTYFHKPTHSASTHN